MTDKLKQLKEMTVVVADTGDIDSIKQYSPMDATTNPSLLFKASQMEQYRKLVVDAIKWGKEKSGDGIDSTLDKLAVNFGREILEIIPGKISTEVDARLSFDTEATIKRAKKIIQLYKDEGIAADRILIKIAGTWEGIKAAEELEKTGINTNITLLFSFYQAVASAEAGAFLISPFVGRILDWYKIHQSSDITLTPATDPGVLSVKQIYQYYKKYEYKTIVMGASFRSKEEIEELAGCDRLTIGPNFLEELKNDTSLLEQKLHPKMEVPANMEKVFLDEKAFRWHLNEDAMATEKLAEGIRNFTKDQIKLEDYIKTF